MGTRRRRSPRSGALRRLNRDTHTHTHTHTKHSQTNSIAEYYIKDTAKEWWDILSDDLFKAKSFSVTVRGSPCCCPSSTTLGGTTPCPGWLKNRVCVWDYCCGAHACPPRPPPQPKVSSPPMTHTHVESVFVSGERGQFR